MASPPGAGQEHMIMIDLPTHTLTDLTAARQGSGFSAKVLCDSHPGFISDGPSDKVSFGSNIVLFEEGNVLSTLDVRSPSSSTPVAGDPWEGHPEYWLWNRITGQNNSVSPDGTYIFNESGVGLAAEHDPVQIPECTGGNAADFTGSFLGWTDSTHAVFENSKFPHFLGLVTVDGTNLGCESLIPPTERNIRVVRLTPDSQRVILAADGPNGEEVYSVDTALPASEPTVEPASHKFSDIQSTGQPVLFFPGNY